jgi:hypothetical protein
MGLGNGYVAPRARRKEKITGRVAGSWRGEFEARQAISDNVSLTER